MEQVRVKWKSDNEMGENENDETASGRRAELRAWLFQELGI